MTAKQARWGKRFLVMTIMLLFLIALCMLGGITASIPARQPSSLGSRMSIYPLSSFINKP